MIINNIYGTNYVKNFKSSKTDKESFENKGSESQQAYKGKYPSLNYFAPNLSVKSDEYYIRMREYGKNSMWVEEILKCDKKLTSAVKNGADFDELVSIAIDGVKEAYSCENWMTSGGVRTKTMQTPYTIASQHERGGEYLERYKEKITEKEGWSPSSNEEYKEANVCKFHQYCGGDGAKIEEGWDYDNEISNLDLAKKEYDKLRSTEEPTEDEINRSVATIHWLIAQESPFQRGSDSIANLITKSIYHAYDMETSPIKAGYSFDFEAWDSNLEDFIENYPDLFEIRPHKV